MMSVLAKTLYISCFLASLEKILGEPDILGHLNKVKSSTPEKDQVRSVEDLLLRLIPNHAGHFIIHVNPSHFNLKNNLDAFEFYSSQDGKINVFGTTGVAAAAGCYHFLKYWCGAHVSWSGDSLNLPATLPRVESPVKELFNGRFRYYQNVCTVSYSMAFWNWKRWEREIDWMALNGINLPLAFTGQESVWQMVYKRLGLTQEELDVHFAGPGFLAWQRMGNIDGWGGPLPPSWYSMQLQLQFRILARMRSFGMIPVLPGFAGHIPKALVSRLYPNATYYKLQSWNGFPGTYLLDATDPLFSIVGRMFLEAQKELYNGTDHVYNADVFNELVPPHQTTDYISHVSRSIFSVMKNVDPNAIWLMQGWLFLQKIWTGDLIKAWLEAVPIGGLIVLDLASDLNPIYKRTHSYYGHPFIWCMIENFGGNTRLYGRIAENMIEVYNARVFYEPYMIGTGLAPEGINQNYINFEIMMEMAWRKYPVNLDEWLQSYLSRRYGKLNAPVINAWKILSKTVYNDSNHINRFHYDGRIPVMRPSVKENLATSMWYDPDVLLSAWKMMIESVEEDKMEDTLRHDIVMVGNQVLEDMTVKVYKDIINAYRSKSASDVLLHGKTLVNLINDMDLLLSTNKYSLLGNWLESAKMLGVNHDEKRLLEFNARNQITLWGPVGEIHDYANKNWGGLMKSFYATRWTVFTGQLYDAVAKGKKFNEEEFMNMILSFEQAWNYDNGKFPIIPDGDTLAISKFLLRKYGNFYESGVVND